MCHKTYLREFNINMTLQHQIVWLRIKTERNVKRYFGFMDNVNEDYFEHQIPRFKLIFYFP